MSTTISLPLSTNMVDLPLQKGNHLIYSYFLESTGIVEVFRALFSSFYVSDKHLKLTETDDATIELIKSISNEVFAKPESSITPPLSELRHNAYWRLFGYTIKGNETSFPKTQNFYAGFHEDLMKFHFNVFQLIFDKPPLSTEKWVVQALQQNMQITFEESCWEELIIPLHILQTILLLSECFNYLLANDDLMVKRLQINSEDPSMRLKALAERIEAPVAQQTSHLFLLAGRMNILLNEIQNRVWDPSISCRSS